ncbi:MAG: ATP-binding cassette domain-containing protein, partial [Anaerolineae bacterium]
IHIPNLAERIGNLSSGQRQAVAIARALYWKTKLLIMDEPTTALGVPERLKVLGLVRTLRDQGVSVIIISQNLQDIFTVADRIVVLRCGQKVGERRTSQTSPDEITRLMMGTEAAGGLYHSSPGLTVNLAPSLRPKVSGK